MPVSDSHRRPEVSRESHQDRVNQARRLAFDAGSDIDAALAENAANPQIRRARSDAMLDRVFPGTTEADYKAFDKAERKAKKDAEHPRVSSIERIMRSQREKKSPEVWKGLRKIDNLMSDEANDAARRRFAGIDYDSDAGRAHRRALDENLDTVRQSLAGSRDKLYGQVKQVGAQSRWTGSNLADLNWLTTEQGQEHMEALESHRRMDLFSPLYNDAEDAAVSDEPAMLWQESVLGHRRAPTDYGETVDRSREADRPTVFRVDEYGDIDQSDEPFYTMADFPDPHVTRRTDGRPWAERRREVFPEDYDEHGNLLPGL